LEELCSREDPSRGASEGAEEVELERGERDGSTVAGDLASRLVDGEAVEGEDGVHGWGDVTARSAGPPQDGLDTCDDLAGAERLGDVVVGAHREAHDAVDLLGPRGDEDDEDV